MSYFSKNKYKGFTLVELIVVMVIATSIMTALVVQQSQWNDSLIVNAQAYEVALEIRQAQIYSLGVREDTVSTNPDKFSIGYGVYFDSNNTRYIYFADRNSNQRYDAGEEIETKTFTRGVLIKDVCGATRCIYSGGGPLAKASITFFRPDPKAVIILSNNGGSPVDNPPVVISLKSPAGKIYSVTVQANGQVSMQ